jgi:hypothetical protein
MVREREEPLPFQVDGMAVHLLDFGGNPSKKSGKNLGLWEISCTFAQYEMNIHFEAYGSIEKSADWHSEL